MKKLYIIGNGFDLHHRLQASYESFGVFLNSEYPTIYENLLCYFGLPDIANSSETFDTGILWSEFETALSYLDSETVIDSLSDYIASPGSPDFRDRDWGAFEIEMQNFVGGVTYELFDAFKDFIDNIKYPISIEETKIRLDKKSKYLTFNYTETLERYYEIPRNNILYIHGSVSHGEDPILGHGIIPETLEIKEEKPPKDLTPEELEKWEEYMGDNYDFSFELGKNELMTYFSKSFKNTKTIINEFSSFFTGLVEIKEVIILGHSLSEVDSEYFAKVFKSVPEDTVWTVSYYHEDEIQSHIEALNTLGVKNGNIKLVEISNLIKKA